MNKNELLVGVGTDYKDMTIRLLEEADAIGLIRESRSAKAEEQGVSPEQVEFSIGIKPNLLGPIYAEEGATTHPEVVAGIIEYLQAHGETNIHIMEGSWVGDVTSDAFTLCGYDRLCDRYNVPFYDMQKEKGIETDCGEMTLNVCEKALTTDFLINVPVLKGHCQTVMTCSLKNMKGLLPNPEKRRFHRMGLHDPIGHLSVGRKQDLIVVDSICGDLTFEDGGHPVQQDRIVIGRDPVLVDAFGCKLMGLELSSVPYIGIAERAGVGSSDVEHASIRWHGDDQAIKASLEATAGAGGWKKILRLSEIAQEVDSCSACYGSLLPALERLDAEGLFDKIDEKIFIGQAFRGETGKLGVGNCTRKFEHSCPGCPPDPEDIYAFLKDYILS